MSPTPPVAWSLLLGLAAAKLLIHAFSNSLAAYGYFPDELYFLDCAERLDWGYVDHGPFSIWLLAALRPLLGDSLPALRLVPALAGAVTLVLTGLLARELGGVRRVQGLAALASAVSLVHLAVGSYYSLNAIDLALWAGVFWVMARLLRGGDQRLWLWLGALIGLGLLNKLSMLWLGAALGVGVAVTPARRTLATRWPWLGAAIALALFTPTAVWQLVNGLPTLEFLRSLGAFVNESKPVSEFLVEQIFGLTPFVAPLWIAGAAYGLFAKEAAVFRPLAIAFVLVLGFLALTGTAQPYYAAPAYPPALAFGGIALERLARRSGRRWLVPAGAAAIACGGLVLAPVALPLLAPERLAALLDRFGDEEGALDSSFDSELPAHHALRFGWPELVDAVARAYDGLPPDERARVGILTHSFGAAAAVSQLGRARGLPSPIGTHVGYWLWGPRDYTGDVLLVVAEVDAPRATHFERPEDYERPGAPVALAELCAHIELLDRVDCRFCTPSLGKTGVFLCRETVRPLPELWPAMRDWM